MRFKTIIETLVKDDKVEFNAAGGTVCWILKEGMVLCEGDFINDVLVNLHYPNSFETLNDIFRKCQTIDCQTCQAACLVE